MFLYTFEKAGSSVLHKLESGEQAFHEALEKGITAVKERRDVSMDEGFPLSGVSRFPLSGVEAAAYIGQVLSNLGIDRHINKQNVEVTRRGSRTFEVWDDRGHF